MPNHGLGTDGPMTVTNLAAVVSTPRSPTFSRYGCPIGVAVGCLPACLPLIFPSLAVPDGVDFPTVPFTAL